jgi:parallel beta-helix repeat protein
MKLNKPSMKSNVFLLLFILTVFASKVYSEIYYVSNIGGNSWWPANGEKGSFLRALDSAAVHFGRDTIRFNLPGGTTLTSEKNPLIFTSSDSDLLIDGLSIKDGEPLKVGYSVNIKGNNIDIEGLHWTVASEAVNISGSNVTLRKCTTQVSGNLLNSLAISGGSNNKLIDCVVLDGPNHGISIAGGSGHLIAGCTITNAAVDGIFVSVASGVTIEENLISGTGLEGIEVVSSGNIIRNNEVFDCNNEYILGNDNLTPIVEQGAIGSSAENTIENNWVYNNHANGIIVHTSSNGGAIKNNIIGRNKAGDELGNEWNGIFVLDASNCNIDGNIVVNNGVGNSHNNFVMRDRISGIRIENTSSGTIQNNYVGTDSNKSNAGNSYDGITLYTNTVNIIISNNVICNNGFKAPEAGNGGGLAIRSGSGDGVQIKSNYIGLHKDLTDGGNNDYGISAEGAANITVGGINASDGNFIGNTKNQSTNSSYNGRGVWLAFGGTTRAEVLNNNIINNAGPGIQISSGASNNIIGASGDGNILSGNEIGILVTGNSENNTMRFNSFSCNTLKGILLENNGNDNYGNNETPKGVLVNSEDPRVGYVSGFSPSSNASVDIYSKDSNCELDCDNSANQGAAYVTTVTASSSISSNGLYSWEYDFSGDGNQVSQETVIVLATENGSAGNVNTSEFSICNLECDTPQNATISSLDFSFCVGETVSLEANADNLSASASYTYAWYLGSISNDNLVESKTDDNTFSTNESGTYFVKVSNQLDPNACFDDSPSAAVQAEESPTATVESSNPAGICEGESVTLSSNATGSNLTYIWSNGELSPNIIVSSGGDYSVTVTSSATECDVISLLSLDENSNPELGLPDSIRFCQDDSLEISAGVSGLEYLWFPTNNITESFYVYSGVTTHRLKVTNPATGCISRDTVVALQSQHPKPSIVLPEDSMMCQSEGDEIIILAKYTAFLPGELQWSDGTIGEDSIFAGDTTIFWAKYLDTFGCMGIDSMKIKNFCIPPEPEVPNVASEDSPFTPTGDVSPEQILEGNLIVYDRWGLEMFRSKEKLPEWKGYNKKGNPCSSGVYFWIWEFKDNTYTDRSYNGFVQFIR